MCGLWFSNSSKITNTPKQNLKLRGPELYNEVSNNLGHFGHALLNTVGEQVIQPVHNHHGQLIYNGSIYNTNTNDTNYIISQLDENLDNNINVIRNLLGEYALCYVTDQNIIFCVDQWGTKNLWFSLDQNSKEIAVSSDRSLLVDTFGFAWIAEDNKIYIVDKKDFSIQKITNTHWNFEQKTSHYDHVFETFEQAVKNRHRDSDTTYLLSSGYDSGVISCCAQKLFSKIDSVTIAGSENKKVLASRCRLHGSNVLKLVSSEIEQDIIKFYELYPFDFIKSASARNFTFIIKKHIMKKDNKIIISGVGGDELFSDYAHPDEKGRLGKIQGVWPSNLDLLYPWHNIYDTKLERQLKRNDFIAGQFGKEIRTPLLDQKLFQAWLNTSVKLKNSGYKSWMKQYMDLHDYAHCDEKIGFDAN